MYQLITFRKERIYNKRMTNQKIQKKGKEPANPSSSKVPSVNIIANEKNNQQNAVKEKVEKIQDITMKEIEKVSSFNLESKMSKLKVSIPLTELVKNSNYKHHVTGIFQIDPLPDMVNVEDDHPELIFGLAIEGQPEDSEVPPFHLSLRLHEYILHNAMLDSGASHNLIPKAIMEKLGLDITQKYHDL